MEQYRGAPLGKPDSTPPAKSPKFSMTRIRINSQGYDACGSYWGIGLPLYWATDGAAIDIYLRGRTRADAKAEIRRTYPNARFYK
jgi:hypothetical protein